MGSYAVNSVAAGKVVLHAARFAHAEVCGVLLGRASEDRDAPVLVEDAIPFFHKSENKNSPIMEVALAQAESYAASTGKKIVGFYQANERNDDTALHPSAKRIGDVIRERGGCPQGCILLLDNEGFTNFLSGEQVERLPFTLYVKRSAWEVATNLLKNLVAKSCRITGVLFKGHTAIPLNPLTRSTIAMVKIPYTLPRTRRP